MKVFRYFESFQIFWKFFWPETWHLRHWLHFWQLRTTIWTITLWPLNTEWWWHSCDVFETHTFLLLEGNGANNQHYIPLTTTPSNISPAFVKRICRFFQLIFQLWPTEFGAFCKNEKLGFHQEIRDVLKLTEPRERATCEREEGNYVVQWCWPFLAPIRFALFCFARIVHWSSESWESFWWVQTLTSLNLMFIEAINVWHEIQARLFWSWQRWWFIKENENGFVHWSVVEDSKYCKSITTFNWK